MRRSFGKLFLMVIAVCMVAGSGTVSAGTISVTQTITITATVAPARSIVVNDQGQMTKIYSNTAENLTPKVYLYDVPGETRPLTPALLKQYNQIISQQKDLVGVAIPVDQPLADAPTVRNILMKS